MLTYNKSHRWLGPRYIYDDIYMTIKLWQKDCVFNFATYATDMIGLTWETCRTKISGNNITVYNMQECMICGHWMMNNKNNRQSMKLIVSLINIATERNTATLFKSNLIQRSFPWSTMK